MEYVTLGSTGITVNKNGFGAFPIQRLSEQDAVLLLKKAFDSGITFFDTARVNTDGEKKIGLALSGVRDKVIIATKTMARDAGTFWEHLGISLDMLQTDYIDIFQFHNPAFCPKPGDGSGLYEAMQEAKAQGKIRHIGFTNHRLDIAREAVLSGLYETVQFPFSYLASPEELDFIRQCGERNMAVIAMKGLAGGLITNSAAAYAFMAQFSHVLPIWGIQRESELDEFISYQDTPPVMNDEINRVIARDLKELGGEFCRGCGYCMPCPEGIEIPTSARMTLLLRRAPHYLWLTDHWREKMKLISSCRDCGFCKERCPYGLDTPKLLRDNLADFQKYL